MATAKDVIRTALSYVGTRANPPGNVVFNTEYYGGKVSGAKFAWCCTFVWYCFKKNKASKLFFNGKKTAYVPAVETYYKKKGQTVAKDEGRMGDLVLFDFSKKGYAGHIGFILKDNKDGTYTTVEGNTSPTSGGSQANGGCVAVKNRTLSQIRCIIRPKYEQAPDERINYTVGKTYYLLSNRSLRTGPATTSTLLGTLSAGGKVTCTAVKKTDKGDVWLKVKEGGWMAAFYNGKLHIG